MGKITITLLFETGFFVLQQFHFLYFQIKDETDDEDLESFSLNVETGDIEKTYITGKKDKKRQYIFVSEDGKTAECIDDLGKKIFWIKKNSLSLHIQHYGRLAIK